MPKSTTAMPRRFAVSKSDDDVSFSANFPAARIPKMTTKAEEKPLAEITLADLLQCSPDIDLSKYRAEHRTASIFDRFRQRSPPNLYSSFAIQNSRSLEPISGGLSFECSMLTSGSRRAEPSSSSTSPSPSSSSSPSTSPSPSSDDLPSKPKPKKLCDKRKQQQSSSPISSSPSWFDSPQKTAAEISSPQNFHKKRFCRRHQIPPALAASPKYFLEMQTQSSTMTTTTCTPRRQPRKVVVLGDEMVAEISSTVNYL